MSKIKGKAPGTVLPGKTKGVIFGASGFGKTWFASSFPVPYMIDTECGASLKHYQERLKEANGLYLGPEDGSLDFTTVIGQIQALATEKHPYKTLIIDSITKLYQVCIANESERITGSGKKDEFGASKKPAIAQMRRLVNWVSKLDMNVWFIAHEVPEWGVGPNGQREEIGRVPDVWDKLVYELDLCLRVIRRGKEYPAIASIHKSRLLGFPIGETFPLEYDAFATRYGKDYIEAATTQLVLIAPEQVAEIERLVSVLKISEEEIEKILTRTAASSWKELSAEQGVKTLEWLQNKINGKGKE
jgi:hypothetical protein